MKKKNILLIGSNEFFSLENMYLRGLKALERNAKILHVYNIRKSLLDRFLWKYFRFISFFLIRLKIFNFLEKNKTQYDLIIIFKGLYLNESFFLKLKKKFNSGKWINIFPDDPLNTNYFQDISNDNLLKTLKYFDYFFIYSKKIANKLRKTIPINRIIYLPFAYDHFVHKKSKKNYKKKYDISFIGTADEMRFSYIKKLINYKVLLAGDGWNKFKLTKNIKYIGKVNAKKSAEIIDSSIISLNILRKQNYESHNMRTFEITSMGGLMLTRRTNEQNLFFPENKACLMYQNKKELMKKISFIINNPKKSKIISNNGQLLSKQHTYKNRAKFILNKIYK